MTDKRLNKFKKETRCTFQSQYDKGFDAGKKGMLKFLSENPKYLEFLYHAQKVLKEAERTMLEKTKNS